MTDGDKPGFPIKTGMTDENKTGFRIRSGMTDEGKSGITQPGIPAKAGIQTDSVIAGFSLEQTIPAFQDLLSVKVDDEVFQKLEPKQKRENIFDAIRDLLISVSQEKPLIVVVEDLHWIDDSSEEFLITSSNGSLTPRSCSFCYIEQNTSISGAPRPIITGSV
jgi:hypothetical protein